jgi:hypothetical protein
MTLAPRFSLPLLALLLSSAALPPTAHAAILTFTDRASFLASLASFYENDFESLPANTTVPAPQSFSGNGFSYDVSSGANLRVVQINSDNSLAENVLHNSLNFLNLSSSIRALGGYFFFNDVNGLRPDSSGTLTASNGIDPDASLSVSNANQTSFFGFFSPSAPLLTVSFSSLSTDRGFMNVDDLITGANVPEPATAALTAAALAAAAILHRRRAS